MAGSVEELVMDVLLQYIITNGDALNLCSAIPTTYTEAITTYNLGSIALTGADYTLAAGDISGRKVTVGAQTGVTIGGAGGTVVYVAITDSGGSDLLLYSSCTPVVVFVGNTVNTTAFDLEIQQVA